MRRAWGKLVAVKDADGNVITDSANPALINPIRYRGYYYDVETGFYYLNSRYYDPGVGRFLNADDLAFLGVSGTTLGYNLYGYCENEPVNNIDNQGYFSFKIVMAAEIAAGIWSFTKYTIKNIWSFNIKNAFKEFVVGFITGAILSALVQLPKAITMGLIGAVFEVISYVSGNIGKGEKLSAGVLLQKALVGFSMGILTNSIQRVAVKMGVPYQKLKSGQFTIPAFIYAFMTGVAKGYLTKFFSL